MGPRVTLPRPPRPRSRHGLETPGEDGTGPAKGMAYLHGYKPPIIHRDLKSLNLLVDTNWIVKITDFGLTTAKEASGTMTQCGTPQWMAPEVLRNEPYDYKADVYSF